MVFQGFLFCFDVFFSKSYEEVSLNRWEETRRQLINLIFRGQYNGKKLKNFSFFVSVADLN